MELKLTQQKSQALGIFAMNNKINVDGDKGYIVVINTDVDKQDCENQDNMAHWTKGQCFNLFWFRPGVSGPPPSDQMHLWDVGDEWRHTFRKYDLSLEEFYNNVWECATSKEVCHNKGHKVKWHQGLKGLPTCFFHMRMVKGSYDAESATMSNVVDVCDGK
jgi:hypothetical protein